MNKGFKNLGSGRIQYVQYFDHTLFNTVFEAEGKFFERKFTMSKKKSFLDKNAIVFYESTVESSLQSSGTTLTFNTLLENSVLYNSLTATKLKEALLERYIHYFCHNVSTLPEISIKFYISSELKEDIKIEKDDIPKINKSDTIDIHYTKFSSDGRSVEQSDKSEKFLIDAFQVPKSIMKENSLHLVSKGEIVEESGVSLKCLSDSDEVEGNRYMFLISSDYIDKQDTNVRGVLNIRTRELFGKSKELFSSEEIVLDDIESEINSKIATMYPAIDKVKSAHDAEFNRLKEMFLLDDESTKDIIISVNDSDSKILEKFYEKEAKKNANIDAELKESVDRLKNLDTRSENYATELKKEVDLIVKAIPYTNKSSLTHYVARRRIVLDLFETILDKKLTIQQGDRNFDEALLHNLLFQQTTANQNQSDLWMISEEYIYFKGCSETKLNLVKIDGKKLFKDKFTEEEEKYLNSLGENRKIKRPDILLFPEEGKCIIIELKSPDVNASEHLTQIDMYANLILNYSNDEFKLSTFYGYLIGQSIEDRDVLGRVGTFEVAPHFGYLFRPSQKVRGFDGKSDGSIYTEVIRYRTLLERARLRNKVFIEKLNEINVK